MIPTELKETLRDHGWRIESVSYEGKRTGVPWYAWKRLDAAHDCTSNEKPPSLCLVPWDIQMSDGASLRTVEFTLAGEVGGDKWVDMKVYSVSMDEAIKAIPRAAAILLAAWNAAATIDAHV